MGDLEPRVFVVDDDHSVRTGLANLLATEDYAVDCSPAPTSTWHACRIAAQHVSSSTCSCLDSTVLALQRQLTEEGRLERIVFITGYGDIPMGIKAMKDEAVDFLPKPFGDDELPSAVAKALACSAEERRQSVRWRKAACGLRSSHHESSRSFGW